MARGNRGGRRTPNNPAAVSGPGALSERTDGGPGSDTQPVRVPTGGEYGEAKALRQQQQGAPLPDNRSPAPSGSPGGPSPAQSPQQPPSPGVWGPTARPGESPLAGAGPQPRSPSTDPDTLARLVYSAFPHPQLLRLIRRRV